MAQIRVYSPFHRTNFNVVLSIPFRKSHVLLQEIFINHPLSHAKHVTYTEP